MNEKKTKDDPRDFFSWFVRGVALGTGRLLVEIVHRLLPWW